MLEKDLDLLERGLIVVLGADRMNILQNLSSPDRSGYSACVPTGTSTRLCGCGMDNEPILDAAYVEWRGCRQQVDYRSIGSLPGLDSRRARYQSKPRTEGISACGWRCQNNLSRFSAILHRGYTVCSLMGTKTLQASAGLHNYNGYLHQSGAGRSWAMLGICGRMSRSCWADALRSAGVALAASATSFPRRRAAVLPRCGFPSRP